MLWWLALVLLLVVVCFHEFYWKRRGLPPGPTPLPLVGNCLQMFLSREHLQVQYRQWEREYGPLHTVWLGSQPASNIIDWHLLKETFVRQADVFTGRPRDPISDLYQKARGTLYVRHSIRTRSVMRGVHLQRQIFDNNSNRSQYGHCASKR